MEKIKTIAIIPARGGSKGISRKNIRLLAGKPLISYVIKAANDSKYIDTVIVSTEDEEIEEISKLYGAQVVKRPEELSEDTIPLDPVIYHALKFFENEEKTKYDFVITIQPTSPLLKTETIDSAIEVMLGNGSREENADKNGYDTLISVKPEPHLYWTKVRGEYKPLYKERKNRQYLDPIYKETGSILISRRNSVSENTRIGEKINLFEIPPEEAIDIDTYQDWMLAEYRLNKKSFIIRVDGYPEIGLGHVYRAITLANRLIFNNDVTFLMDSNKEVGINKVLSYHLPVVTFDSEEDLFPKLEQINPDIVINDILDTDLNYIEQLKKMRYFVVNFEDLGEGTESADLVINSLYEYSHPAPNHHYGHNYVCLRDEFYIVPPKKVEKPVKKILITFGGTDPNNLTLKALKAVRKMSRKDIQVNVVLGFGYLPKEELYAYVENLLMEGYCIEVKENVQMMAREIYNADLVITSNGRTIYEITSIGTPFISISQNERESRHLFVHYLKGIMYLGMAYDVSELDIVASMNELINDYKTRKKINENLLKVDIKQGINRVVHLILDKYEEWRKDENLNNCR